MAWVTVGVMAAGAVAGKMKNDHAKDVENSQRNLAAETQRYSPWTGMKANAIPMADSAGGDIFAGGLSGAMAGQGLQKGMAGMKPSAGGEAGGLDMNGQPLPKSADDMTMPELGSGSGRFGRP